MEAQTNAEKFLASVQIMREESLRLGSISCQPLENTLCKDTYYRVESTRAIVTLNSSVPLIHFFCSKLPSDELVFCFTLNSFVYFILRRIICHNCFKFMMGVKF